MTDILYILTSIGFFALMIVFIWALRKSLTSYSQWKTLIVGIIALGLIVYLILTIIRPEKF